MTAASGFLSVFSEDGAESECGSGSNAAKLRRSKYEKRLAKFELAVAREHFTPKLVQKAPLNEQRSIGDI
jgi:hypothetical protein